MNREHLNTIFSNYIEKFEYINNAVNDENYKWRVAYSFHELMNPNGNNFLENIKEASRLCFNLIDSGSRYCFSSMVKCAEIEPETVKNLFRELFANDDGDLVLRQNKILKFIKDSNEVIGRLVSSNGMFMNDQRSAMAYLFLYDPDNHYLYKASEATDFASCIEYYEDWGPGTDFKLDVYYRMCDLIVEEIRDNQELIKTHKSRYYGKDNVLVEGMHADKNYHILTFDIIYGAPENRYNFYKGIPFTTITAQARRLHQERVEKAQEREIKLIEAREKAYLLADAEKYFKSVVHVGLIVKHKQYGEGQITEVEGTQIRVLFPENNESKKFEMMRAFVGGFLTADIPDLAKNVAVYRAVVNSAESIKSILEKAEIAFKEYEEYLR